MAARALEPACLCALLLARFQLGNELLVKLGKKLVLARLLRL